MAHPMAALACSNLNNDEFSLMIYEFNHGLINCDPTTLSRLHFSPLIFDQNVIKTLYFLMILILMLRSKMSKINPPEQNVKLFTDVYNELLDKISLVNKSVYIMGDLNLDLMKYQRHSMTGEQNSLSQCTPECFIH